MNHSFESPLITTVIPTYRRPKQLQRAIRSVLNQTYPNFQVCIYDNDSGDETSSIVRQIAKIDPRVKYYCHSQNIGAFKNFIFGMERASVGTPFFSFLSDDDILLPEFYQEAIEALCMFPAAIFYGGATIAMTEEGVIRDVSSMWEREGYFEPPDGLLKMMANNLAWTSILFRREVINEVGGLDLEVGAPFDLDFLLRIAARFPFMVSGKPSAIWIDSPDSHSGRADSKFVWPGWLKMIRNLTGDQRILLHIRENAAQILTIQLQRKLFWLGANSILRKNFEDAYQVVRIFRMDYHQTAKANLLFLVAVCCEHLPLAHTMLGYLNLVRKLRGRKNGSSLQRRFGSYARFLQVF